MIEAVFDTNVFLQATAAEKGPANACWKFSEERKIHVFVTENILAEIEGCCHVRKSDETLQH